MTAAVPNEAGFLSPGSIFLVSGDNVNMTITGNFLNVVTNNISPFITVTAGYTVVFQNCLFQDNIGEYTSSTFVSISERSYSYLPTMARENLIRACSCLFNENTIQGWSLLLMIGCLTINLFFDAESVSDII